MSRATSTRWAPSSISCSPGGLRAKGSALRIGPVAAQTAGQSGRPAYLAGQFLVRGPRQGPDHLAQPGREELVTDTGGISGGPPVQLIDGRHHSQVPAQGLADLLGDDGPEGLCQAPSRVADRQGSLSHCLDRYP